MSAIQRQYALDYLKRMDTREYGALAELLSENFTHQFLPTALKGLGVPVRNKQQFLDLLNDLEATFQCFNVILRTRLHCTILLMSTL